MKSLMMMVALMAARMAASAEYPAYFYLRVNSSTVNFAYAKLRLKNSNTYFNIGDTAYKKIGAETIGDATSGTTTLAVAANLGEYAAGGRMFVVEVFGEDDRLLGYSNTFSYEDIAGSFVYVEKATGLSSGAYGVDISHVVKGTMLLISRLDSKPLTSREDFSERGFWIAS